MNNGEDWTEETYELAQKAIGYRFRNKHYLLTAFTHKSYSNAFGGECNERMEFLGDAILEMYVSEQLYFHSPKSEGVLTELRKNYVSEPALTAAEEMAGLMPFLRISGKRENIGGKTPSNLFEAVVAAIYLDGGIENASIFMDKFLVECELENDVRILQEYVQEKQRRLPAYSDPVAGEDGKFYCTVEALGKKADGSGESKQAAKMNAAKTLLEIIGKGKEN